MFNFIVNLSSTKIGVNKQDIVTHTDETLNLALFEDASVCSCDDIQKCYQLYADRIRLKRKQFKWKNIFEKTKKQQTQSNETFNAYDTSSRRNTKRIKFTIMRPPCANVTHLSQQDNSDACSGLLVMHRNRESNLLQRNQTLDLEIKRLAIESDFITSRILKRRVSI